VILDTNAFFAMAEGEPGLEPVLRQATQVGIPVIVLGEYRFGIAQSRKRAHYEHWLSEYLPVFRILDVDEQTTQHYADVRVELKKAGNPIPSNDVWIAALCRQHSLPILSRDRHFDAVAGVTRLTW
jgi:tRNA(fMet)-specific endonuclease VapC